MTAQTPPFVLAALFPNRDCAEGAHDALVRRGFGQHDISVAMRQEDEAPKVPLAEADAGDSVGAKAVERGAKGAAIGGTAGALIGILAAAGSIVIPGIGLVIAGPLAAALAGLAAGGVAGGVAGLLVGAGVPEEEARGMETAVKGGRILLAVRVPSHDVADELRREWEEQFRAEGIRELPARSDAASG